MNKHFLELEVCKILTNLNMFHFWHALGPIIIIIIPLPFMQKRTQAPCPTTSPKATISKAWASFGVFRIQNWKAKGILVAKRRMKKGQILKVWKSVSLSIWWCVSKAKIDRILKGGWHFVHSPPPSLLVGHFVTLDKFPIVRATEGTYYPLNLQIELNRQIFHIFIHPFAHRGHIIGVFAISSVSFITYLTSTQRNKLNKI